MAFSTGSLKLSWISSPHRNLIPEEAGLLKVKAEVHLARAAEVGVQQLHTSAHQLWQDEFIVHALHGAAVEAGASFIDGFEVLLLRETVHHGLASRNDLHKLRSRGPSRRVCCGQGPFRQPHLLTPAYRRRDSLRLAAVVSACPSLATVGPKSSFKILSSGPS